MLISLFESRPIRRPTKTIKQYKTYGKGFFEKVQVPSGSQKLYKIL